MTEPTASVPGSPLPRSNAPVVIRIILAILLGIPGIIGLIAFAALVGDWLHNGLQFEQSPYSFTSAILIAAESGLCFSVLALGIILRYARWRRARTASLVLAVLSAAVIVLGYQLMIDCLGPDDTDDQQVAMVFSVLGLIIISAPPLLHWWKAGRIRS
jgi:hypothetical protein